MSYGMPAISKSLNLTLYRIHITVALLSAVIPKHSFWEHDIDISSRLMVGALAYNTLNITFCLPFIAYDFSFFFNL